MKRILIITFALLIALGIIAAKSHPDRPVRLYIQNKTDQDISVRLSTSCSIYYFVIPPNQGKTYTVDRKRYTASIVACNRIVSREINIFTQSRLTFPACDKLNVPGGEGSIIKIPVGAIRTATPLPTQIVVPP